MKLNLRNVVVVLIVGILAAVAIPRIRSHIDAGKWSEGKAAMGTIATALRAYAAEKGATGMYGEGLPTLTTLGFSASDLHETYFTIENYYVETSAFVAGNDPALTFTIKATSAGTGITSPSEVRLNQAGTWTETE